MQQEKQKLGTDQQRQVKKQEEMQAELTQLTNKYELAVKEKMLMKLEKDRLIAKVENLEISMNQLSEEQSIDKTCQRPKPR